MREGRIPAYLGDYGRDQERTRHQTDRTPQKENPRPREELRMNKTDKRPPLYIVATWEPSTTPGKLVRYTKEDVRLHSDQFGGGNAHPAVNVKCYRPSLTDKIANKFACSEDVAQQAAEIAWDAACEEFWRYWAEECDLADYFPGHSVEVYGEGQSHGWLVVHGLPPVESWNAVDLARWRRFEREVESDVEYRSSAEYALEAIEANGWTVTPQTAATLDVGIH